MIQIKRINTNNKKQKRSIRIHSLHSHNSYIGMPNSGYAALISVIIISLILIALTAAAGTSGLFTRFNILEMQEKLQSNALAESCINLAMSRLTQNSTYSYPVPETMSFGQDHCTINNINGTGTQKQIGSFAGYLQTFTNLSVGATVDVSDLTPTQAVVLVRVLVNNTYGGTAVPGDFIVSVSAASPSPINFNGNPNGVPVYIDSGSFSANISSSIPSNYSAPLGDNCSIASIEPGSNTNICTISLNDNPTTGTLAVVANVVNDNGGTHLPSDFSLSIDGTSQSSGTPRSGLAPGTHTVSAASFSGYSVSSWDGGCPGGSVDLSAGDTKTCTVTYDDNAPPTPVCADTVVMLSGGMSSGDLANEGTAARALVSLYSNVTPHPLVAVGSYGGLDGSNAQVPTSGQLTSSYGSNAGAGTGLYGLINQIVTTINSSGGTNLSAAITAAHNEINSIRHVAGHAKVIVFVSDGKPNLPSGNADRTGLSLAAADTAKLAADQIFSIHYGTSSGRDLVAQLATGTTANSGHQPGSHNDVTSANSSSQINAENADGDNFFIAPTSADMTNIFQTIGRAVCPAVDVTPPAPPTHANIIIITNVTNDNGGVASAGNFTAHVSAVNPSGANFAGSASPGTSVQVDPGAYTITENALSGYSESLNSACSGTITAGTTKTCIINNNDLPPSPSSIPSIQSPSMITINTWQENP